MVVKEHSFKWSPIGAPLSTNTQHQSVDDEPMSPFISSVDALSFGFIATAILVFMFFAMAIFEKYVLKHPSSPEEVAYSGGRRNETDIESTQLGKGGEYSSSSTEMCVYANGVSVLMPGDDVPSYIARPAPVMMTCPPQLPTQNQSCSTSPNFQRQ